MVNLENVDINSGVDLSIGIGDEKRYVRAWYLPPPEITPVKMDGFVGEIAHGSAVNFKNVFFNPHAHGTHTETYGHVMNQPYFINEVHFPLLMSVVVISVYPMTKVNSTTNQEDQIITKDSFSHSIFGDKQIDAVIFRTSESGYLNTDFSNSNPPYFDAEIANLLRNWGVKHLLIDLPSVDREDDGGALAFHHAFWNTRGVPDKSRTITEFIHVPETVSDGLYALNLQVSNFANDAAPSKPIIYRLKS